MRIVQVEDFFHPSAGYQINVLSKYLTKFGHDVYILTAEMDKVPEGLTRFFGTENILQKDAEYSQKYGVKIIRLPVWRFISSRAIFTRKLEETIESLEPDVLYVHGCDTYAGIKLILKKRLFHCGMITDSHMLEMASQNRFKHIFRRAYRSFVTPVICRNRITVIRTQNDDFVKEELGIPLMLAPWISYGSDTTLFYPDKNKRMEFRKENEIGEEDFVVTYAGKLDESKGGLLLATAIEKKIPGERETVFLIVGNTTGDYGRKIEEKLERSENKVIRFPTQTYDKLPVFFQAADAVVFPRQCSLSFYDAQACGVPVISEDNNINRERCSHKNGSNFTSGSADKFREEMIRFATMSKKEAEICSLNALNYIRKDFDYEKRAREYELLIRYAADKSTKRKR